MLTNYTLIKLNGRPFNCSKNLLLSELLLYLNIQVDSTIVEYNGEIIQEVLLSKIALREGDNIELLTVVGGG